MAIDTVYRLRLDFDVYNGDVIDTKEQEDKDQISIAKISQFIFEASNRFKLESCETSEGCPSAVSYSAGWLPSGTCNTGPGGTYRPLSLSRAGSSPLYHR